MGWWPQDEWARMLVGDDCPMCADAHLPSNEHSDLIAELPSSYARLSRNQARPGYSVVVFKRHAPELHDLAPDELSGFWCDVAAVGRAVTALFAPVKLDNLVMGHLCPHVHCHVYPQYRTDDPHALIDINEGDVRLGDDERQARVSAMRRLLTEDHGTPAADPGLAVGIRPGDHDDVDAVLAIWSADDVEPTITDDSDSIHRLLARDPSALLVAERDGQIVGTLVATWDGWRASMWRLAVRPSQRRQGIARALVLRAEQRLRTLGARRIATFVATTDVTPTRFWTALGYQPQSDRLRLVKNLAVDVDQVLQPGSEVVVRRAKLAKDDVLYPMTVESDDGDHVVVVGPFSGSLSRDLGYVRFDPEDRFVEHFWRSRWYSVADVQDPIRGRKGWYCDVTRPAEVAPGSIVSTDLDLDLWVPAGEGPVLILDEDEFVASGLPRTDPVAAAQARQALQELHDAAQDRFRTLL